MEAGILQPWKQDLRGVSARGVVGFENQQRHALANHIAVALEQLELGALNVA